MGFETADYEVRKRLDKIIEQNQQIATLLNKILTALERQNGKSEGTLTTQECRYPFAP